MKFREWTTTVPDEITKDSLWKLQVYQYALFLSDIAWKDISYLSKKKELISLCDQLYRSTGSIATNIEEGYSKKSHLDRARYFEYALGSARESRGWYFRARHSLPGKIFESRLILLTEIIKLLLHIVPKERKSKIQEPRMPYSTDLPDTYSQAIESLELDIPN